MQPKTQASLEYLMTYGWALVLVAAIIGTLVFVFSAPQGVSFSSSQPTKILIKGSVFLDDMMAIKLQNITGGQITITNIASSGYYDCKVNSKYIPPEEDTIGGGNEFVIECSDLESATGEITLTYTDIFGLEQTIVISGSGNMPEEDFGTGTGTLDDPSKIRDCESLQAMKDNMDAYYALERNIDCTGFDSGDGKGFAPIGNSANPFHGTFDGKNHTITGLAMDRETQNEQGLFGYIDAGKVKDLGIINANIKGAVYVGILAGTIQNATTISNVYATGTSNGTSYVGGLIGYSSVSTIDDSYATVQASGSSYVGGLVGVINNTTIDSSYATVQANGSSYVGGLVGYAVWSTVKGSHAAGNVEGGSNNGLLVGYNYYSTIRDCHAAGNVEGAMQVGGLVGWNERSPIEASYADATVNGTEGVGGLVGHNKNSIISQCRSSGSVTASIQDAGGVAGKNIKSGSLIILSYSTASVNSPLDAGGLVGDNKDYAQISRSYATGNVTGTGSGSVSIGGLVGENQDGGKIYNSYATGSVSGYNKIGGFVGENQAFGSQILNSYSTGLVTGTSNVGGLVGENRTGATATASFWDKETSQKSSSAAGTGKTTAQMKDPATFAGWSQNFWNIAAGQYPILKSS